MDNQGIHNKIMLLIQKLAIEYKKEKINKIEYELLEEGIKHLIKLDHDGLIYALRDYQIKHRL